MATRLPTLQKEKEGLILGKMLEELNSKFALQLDLKPSTDRSGQEASDPHDPNDMLNVVFAGSSHSVRNCQTTTRLLSVSFLTIQFTMALERREIGYSQKSDWTVGTM